MAKSTVPLAADKSGPHRIDQEGREEHSFLCGTNGKEKVQDSDIRVPEHPREVGKTELDCLEHGVAAKKVRER